ncbi:MAG: ATP-dependent DNA helicase RecG, partial [Patescibacteria group bacterium]
IIPIAALTPNQPATVRGTVRTVELRRTWRRNMTVTEAVVTDATGGVKAVWFNQPYVGKILRPGSEVNLAGKVSIGKGASYLSNPSYELVRSGNLMRHTGGLIPVYPETKGLTSRGLRYLVKPILEVIPRTEDFIPGEILTRYAMPSLDRALRDIHFPTSFEDAKRARDRFAFEDLFLLQILNLKLRSELAKESAEALALFSEDERRLREALPFTLTESQEQSLREILADIAKPNPMNRLLQGDVGSGKTVIAAFSAIAAARRGTQAAFMAPTEILARQHYETLTAIFGSLLTDWNIPIHLVTGSQKATDRKGVARIIQTGSPGITVGTHALIQKNIAFPNLSLVIVDEQHRFGVAERAKLLKTNGEKTLKIPHFLSMSATPIPRTLSLTIFGDLDVSLITELPKGRKPIMTRVVPPEKRKDAYGFIRKEIALGRQAFVICPRIAETTNDARLATDDAELTVDQSFVVSPQSSVKYDWDEVKAVEAEYTKLANEVFPDLRVAKLHGKMSGKAGLARAGAAEGSGSAGKTIKEQVMKDFRDGKTDILVATSVIEVGVDVPNASIMVVEGAERFGLAQLYQLRGRIGRGEHQSYCLLFTTDERGTGEERLAALVKAKNGFELAELDLAMRGPGEFLGDKQTGMPDLTMGALSDIRLIKAAREGALSVIEGDPTLKSYPLIAERVGSFERSVHLE